MRNELLPVLDIQPVLLRCCYLSALQVVDEGIFARWQADGISNS